MDPTESQPWSKGSSSQLLLRGPLFKETMEMPQILCFSPPADAETRPSALLNAS